MKNKNSTKDRSDVVLGFSTLSFNLRFGLADDGANSWDHRKKALPALFKKYRPDFIGLQEANDFQIDYLTKVLIGYEFKGPWFKDAAPKPCPGTFHGFSGRTDGDHID